MKTEIQIADENIEIFNNPFPDGIKGNPWTNKIRNGIRRDIREVMETHKSSCQIFLEFLESTLITRNNLFKNKITELQKTIKIYSEAGI